jgi:threonine synthase
MTTLAQREQNLFNATETVTQFYDEIENLSNETIAFEVIKQFVGVEIPEEVLKNIIAETLSFDFPLIDLSNYSYINISIFINGQKHL